MFLLLNISLNLLRHVIIDGHTVLIYFVTLGDELFYLLLLLISIVVVALALL